MGWKRGCQEAYVTRGLCGEHSSEHRGATPGLQGLSPGHLYPNPFPWIFPPPAFFSVTVSLLRKPFSVTVTALSQCFPPSSAFPDPQPPGPQLPNPSPMAPSPLVPSRISHCCLVSPLSSCLALTSPSALHLWLLDPSPTSRGSEGGWCLAGVGDIHGCSWYRVLISERSSCCWAHGVVSPPPRCLPLGLFSADWL